jgi:hypothetical protein
MKPFLHFNGGHWLKASQKTRGSLSQSVSCNRQIVIGSRSVGRFWSAGGGGCHWFKSK